MPWRIDEIKNILLPIFCSVVHPYRLAFDGNTAFLFQFHRIQQLLLHISLLYGAGHLYHAIRQRRFSVIYMCNNTKIANIVLGMLAHAILP